MSTSSSGAKFTGEAIAARKENLRRLVLDKFMGNRAAFSRATGVHQNQINLILTDNEEHRRNMGEQLARKFESTLSLPQGYLDTVHDPMQGTVTIIEAWNVPKELQHMLITSDQMASVVHKEGFFTALDPQITSRANLRYCLMVSSDMSPLIHPGDRVLVDTGVKAVSFDGIYVVTQGDGFFLRRCGRNLDGSWTVHAPNPAIEPRRLKDMKGIQAVCRLVQVSRVEML